MSYGYAYDGPPAKCATGARPGTKALRDGVMERFGCGDDGIFNCRPIHAHDANGNQIDTLSFHADGRAWDAHCTGELNKRIALWAVQFANALGVQEVISYRRRWDSIGRTWRVYNGDDPHTGHVHIAQCIRAANTLTLATVRAIEDGAPGPTPPTEDDMPLPSFLAKSDDATDTAIFLVEGNFASATHLSSMDEVTWLRQVNSLAPEGKRFLVDDTIHTVKASVLADIKG